ncbi:18973_t:CDS:2, partial [Gigaspora rosea]
MDITFCLNCILLSSSSAYHWVTGTILFSATTSLRFASSGPDKLNQEYSFIYKLDCISKNKRSKNQFDEEATLQTSQYINDQETT